MGAARLGRCACRGADLRGRRARPTPGPLDDPDPADQRDGLLLSGPVVDDELLGIEFGRRPVVLLFLREPASADDLAGWVESIRSGVDSYVVVPQATAADLPLPTVVDPLSTLAGAVDMPQPVDGGRPVGYAVVDSQRIVRYATLDPSYLTNAFELETILGAVE